MLKKKVSVKKANKHMDMAAKIGTCLYNWASTHLLSYTFPAFSTY